MNISEEEINKVYDSFIKIINEDFESDSKEKNNGIEYLDSSLLEEEEDDGV